MVNGQQPTHTYCGKYECVKRLLPHTVSYEFDDSLTMEDILAAQRGFTGNFYQELPVTKPTTLHEYKVYQGDL